MSDANPEIERIGFLNAPTNFVFDGGKLLLLPDFRKIKRWVERHANLDGFIYPPMSYRARVNPSTGRKTRVSKTRKPALLHPVPPSHQLILDGVTDMQKARSSLSGFVVQCFAFLYGTRLQFWDWWFEGRVPITPTVNVIVTQTAAERFVSKAIRTWKSLDTRSQMVATNLLYIFSKAGSVEWDWERFQLEYIVTDACYAIANRRVHSGITHSKRIQTLCSRYELSYNLDLISTFIRLRNDLFHEALWDGASIHSAGSSESSMASGHFRRFNHRLIASIFAGPSDYTRSDWWFLGPDNFQV